jgi:hypothetical protein
VRYGSVYLLHNKHTGEQYVGQTIKSVMRRWYAHCISAQKPKFRISHNIAQHGKEAFDVVELFVAFDKTALDFAEKELIAALVPSLNATKGGAGSPRTTTPEERKQRSEAAKRRWANQEWKEKTVESLKRAVRPVIPYEVLKERGQAACAKRWAGHVKKTCVPNGTEARTAQRAAITTKTWQSPEIRAKRIEGLRQASAQPEVKARRALANTGRIMPRASVEKSARAKWKPVYCPELQISFLSQKHAAEFLGVLRTTVSNAIKQKGRVQRKFTLEMVA